MPRPTYRKTARWTMPKWMRRFEPFIVNTGGNDVTEMVNGHADPRVNLPLSTLQACVKSQVALLEQLKEANMLGDALRGIRD